MSSHTFFHCPVARTNLFVNPVPFLDDEATGAHPKKAWGRYRPNGH